ncbi:MAG: hypothetical protein JSV88_09345 [Candidatus Aminicenantes bacterium]|nr:MAG: hypothetical protein JSV88_09345 [Candidatus Aminicenantes bacterium]
MLVDIAALITEKAFKLLAKRHAVDHKHLLDHNIEEQFKKCINLATSAFIERVKRHKHFKKEDLDFFINYLKGKIVSEEISKLLDPGLEIFDIDLLTSYFEKFAADKGFNNYNSAYIKKAWDEFLRAFSFASRSAPDLREFLRASYEAGSFRALSDIHDVIEDLENIRDAVNEEENRLKYFIGVYSSDLQQYRDWAHHFFNSR